MKQQTPTTMSGKATISEETRARLYLNNILKTQLECEREKLKEQVANDQRRLGAINKQLDAIEVLTKGTPQ